MILNDKQKQFITLCNKEFGEIKEITRKQLVQVEKKYKVAFPQWLVSNKDLKISKGLYKMPTESDDAVTTTVEKTVNNSTPATTNKEAAYIVSSLTGNIVPTKDKNFVSFGNYPDVKNIIKSNRFYPVFITGLSGNGNITIETDEDDLLGGYRLKDGQTVWQNGPVIEAMERGAVLLLDEIDLASNKIMCLQPILEGSGVFVKKINKWVKPKDGFNVIATANTKGQGSEDGKFIGTNVLNEAFLERFPVTFEQKYPATSTEKKILVNTLKSYGKSDVIFVDKLVTWADVIRKTYFDGGVDEIISTRRLVHIAQAYAIFGNKMKSIEMCTNRFDDDTKNSFVELYTKVDSGVSADQILDQQRQEGIASQMDDNDNESDSDEDIAA
jgi:hypothetical protein